MCQIIFSPRGTSVTLDELLDATRVNRDALGIGYYLGDHPIVHKRVKPSRQEIEELHAIIEEQKDNNVLIHARFATNGENNYNNCHPFVYNNTLYAHNGILSTAYSNDVSDSRLFIEAAETLFTGDSIQTLFLEKLAGASKIIKMNPYGECVFVNESKGEWNKSRWFSAGYGSCSTGWGSGSYWDYDAEYGGWVNNKTPKKKTSTKKTLNKYTTPSSTVNKKAVSTTKSKEIEPFRSKTSIIERKDEKHLLLSTAHRNEVKKQANDVEAMVSDIVSFDPSYNIDSENLEFSENIVKEWCNDSTKASDMDADVISALVEMYLAEMHAVSIKEYTYSLGILKIMDRHLAQERSVSEDKGGLDVTKNKVGV